MNKFYFANEGIDRGMSYKKYKLKSHTKSISDLQLSVMGYIAYRITRLIPLAHSLLWPGVLQRRIYYCSWVKLSTICSQATEAAPWVTHSFSRPQPATENSVSDGRSNWLSVAPALYRAVPPLRHLHRTNLCRHCRESNPEKHWKTFIATVCQCNTSDLSTECVQNQFLFLKDCIHQNTWAQL